MRSPTRSAPTPAQPDPPVSADPALGDRGEPSVRRLGRTSKAWRAAILLVGVLLVVWGTLFGSDLYWPFGPMSQFAFRIGPNDGIHSTFLEARDATGTVKVVPLSPRSVGIARAEIEGQLPNIQREPALLKNLATEYHRLHPGEPQLVQLWLRDRVTELHNGRAAGEHIVPLVGWPVDDR